MINGGLFVSRPRSVTVGLGLAGIMGCITTLMGLGMFFGLSSIYVGMTTFIELPATDHSVTQGLIVIITGLLFLTAVIRALKPARVPRFITIAISGLVGLLWFYTTLPDLVSVQDWIRTIITTALMASPAILLMTPSASEFYGD